MMWFWNQYTMSNKERNEITASPLRATLEELEGLPDAMILNGEADVLRDEGEEYARKLRKAGVDVTAIRTMCNGPCKTIEIFNSRIFMDTFKNV